MGSGDEGTHWFYYVFVSALGVLALIVIFTLSLPGPYHNHVIEGVEFIPATRFELTDEDPEVTDELRDQIHLSNIHLVIEIENTSLRWVRIIEFHQVNGKDFFEVETGNTAPMIIRNLEPERIYRYHIRIECVSDNETVRSLSFLDQENYFSGTFKVEKGDPDKLVFPHVDRPLYETRDRQWVVYSGKLPNIGPWVESSFTIELVVIEYDIVSS